MKKIKLFFPFLFVSVILSFSYGQFITVNGTTITDGGGGPSCNSGNFKRVNSATLETNCMRFTNGTFQNGAVWVCNTIDLDQGFKVNFTANFGNNTAGGDGMAFVVQREGAPGVIGGRAGGIGYAQGDGTSCQSAPCPINPSVAVEFDTWDNTADGINDIAANHIAIHRNGEMNAANTLAGPISAISGVNNIRDGLDHAVCITWDPAINRMQVYFDGNLRLTYNGNIRTVFGAGANTVWWGFTAGSGGASQTQRVCNVTMLTNVSSPSCVCTAPVATATPNPQTICSGNATGVNLTSNIAGTTFTWVAAANANVTGESTTNQTGSTITDVLVNTTATAQVVNYTVTPTASGCPGTAITVPVTVNPTPVMTSSNSATICSGQTVSIPLTTNPTGSTFTWVATDNANVTGESLTNQTTSTLSNTLTNNSSTVQVVSYTVTPTLNGCSGTPQTVNVTVNPIPTVNAISSQELCAGSPTTAVNFTGNNGSTTYNWTNDNTSIGLAASGSGNIASFTAANGGTTAQVATITVTPVLNGCTGTPQVFTITVNPVPTVDVISSQVLCAGSPTTAINFTGNSGLTTYNWTNDNTSIGLAAIGSGNIASFEALNSGSTVQVATITVTPVLGSCSGIPQTFTITVNPIPTVNAISSQELCAGSPTTAVNFTGNNGSTTYNWTNDNTSIGLAASGSGNIASFTAANGGTTAQVATITVTPVLNGCTGTPQVFTITVNPVPTVDVISSQVLCAGSPTTAINFTGNSGLTTYNWTNDNTSIGLAAIGSGNIASFEALNSGSTVQVATITVTPVLGSCSGIPQTFTITVNPIPTVNAISGQELCAGSSTVSVNFSGNIGTTAYEWTNDNMSIGLSGSGTGSIGSFVTLNSGTTAQVATIEVTPNLNGCVGTPQTFTITVNPIPVIALTQTPLSACNAIDGEIEVALTSGSTTSGTVNWTGTASGTSGLTTLPYDMLNLGAGNYNVTFTDANGCVSTTVTSVLNNPGAPIIDAIADYEECNAPYTLLLSTITGDLLTGNQGYFSAPNGGGIQYPDGHIFPVGTNNVQVYVYDIFGLCAAEVSFFVTVNANPMASITPDPAVVCEGVALPLNGNPSGGSGAFSTHSWTVDNSILSSSTIVNPSVLASTVNGTYNLTYTVTDDNGCVGSDNITVAVNETPVLSLNNPAAVCSPSTIDITDVAVSNTTVGTLSYFTDATFTTPLADPTAVGEGTYYVVASNGTCTDNGSVTVTVTETPVLTLNSPAAVCAPATVDITNAVISSTTVGTLAYFTDAGFTTPVADPTSVGNGTYFVVATNGSCTDNGSITVTVTNAPVLAVNNPAAVCSPSTVDLTNPLVASTTVGTLSYFTDVALTIPVADPTAVGAGTYYVLAASGTCTDNGSVTVTVTETPVLTLNSPAAVCAPATVDITNLAVSSTTVGALAYYTDAGLTTPVVDPTSVGNGIYYVQATNLGCTASGSVTVTVNTLPVISGVGNDPSVCNGTDGSIDVNLTSGPLSTGILNWTGTSSGSDVSADLTANPNINGLITGNYDVTFIDGNGCVSNLISIELINPGAPQITNPGAQTACDSYTLPAISGPVLSGNQSYWTGSGGTGTQLSPGDVLTSTQLIYIYDVFGTCVDEEVFTVTINVTPSITNPGPQVACNNYDLPVITGTNLNAAAYYNNSQANGGTLISGPITSSQTIFIYDQNGSCFDEVSFTVTINPSPVLVSISGGATYCAGADVADILVEVTGSPDYTLGYTLDGTAQTVASSNGTINLGNAAGTYVVTSLEDAGCTASVSGTQTIVVNPVPTAPIAGDDATYCYYDEFTPMYAQTTLNGTLTWYSDAGLSQQVGTGESLLPSSTVGTYTYYVVETAANCQGPSTLVTIVVEQCETEIPTAFTPDGDGVNDFWIIPDLSTNFPDNVVRVYNRWGNLIFESEGYATPWDGTYNGAELPVASYYFIVDFNDGGVTKPASGTVTIVRNK
jgi:gliding motility-associated-like protein